MTRLTLAATLLLLTTAATAPACQVPVFRFALDNWTPDPLSLTVLHRGPLSADTERWLADLHGHAGDAPGPLNVAGDSLALDGEVPAEMADLVRWAAHRELPLAVLRSSEQGTSEEPFWSGPLTSATRDALIESPIRR